MEKKSVQYSVTIGLKQAAAKVFYFESSQIFALENRHGLVIFCVFQCVAF